MKRPRQVTLTDLQAGNQDKLKLILTTFPARDKTGGGISIHLSISRTLPVEQSITAQAVQRGVLGLSLSYREVSPNPLAEKSQGTTRGHYESGTTGPS